MENFSPKCETSSFDKSLFFKQLNERGLRKRRLFIYYVGVAVC